MVLQNDSWKVIDSYFEERGLVRQQIESYDEFLTENVIKIIETSQPIEIENKSENVFYSFKFRNCYIGKPVITESNGDITHLTPNQARLRNLTYEVNVYVNIHTKKIKKENNEEIILDEKDETTKLCSLPLMLNTRNCVLFGKSNEEKIKLGECEFDQGGYFIVNGSEKVLIAQEKMAANQVYVFLNKMNYFVAEIRSVQEGELKAASQVLLKYVPPPKKNTIVSNNIIRASLSFLKKEIPVVILFKALGVVDHDDIYKRIINYNTNNFSGVSAIQESEIKELFKSCFDDAFIIKTQEEAIEYMGKRTLANCDTKEKRFQFIMKSLTKDFLPHISTDENSLGIKSYFLGYMVNKLFLTVNGKRDVDDRDNYGNKRLELSGSLLGNLFKLSFIKMCKEFRFELEKDIISNKNMILRNIVPGKDITKDIKYAMATGNWSSANQKTIRTGVSQVLSRLSYAATLSHLRRINAPIAKDGKSVKPRQLHNTTYSIICPAETPEGHACGLVKNLSLMTHISINTGSDLIEEFLNEYGIKKLDKISEQNEKIEGIKIFLNGKWIGIHNNPKKIYDELITLKRYGKIYFDVSIKIIGDELIIDTDGGRCCSPLLVVENNSLKVSEDDIKELINKEKRWTDLVNEGKIEFLDVNEMSQSMIATTFNEINESKINNLYGYNYSHCEIHPSMILGICGSIVPLPDHNQAPRNTYEAAMSKQAMGMYTTNHQMRMDTLAHVLMYPQKPLVQTKSAKYINYNDMPSGQNVIVAIACYSGYNQEDSILLNKSAVDRGMFRSVFYRSYKDEESSTKDGTVEHFSKPDPVKTLGTRNINCYNNIDEDGLPKIGAKYNNSDILIGKTVPVVTKTDPKLMMTKFTHKDISVPIRSTENGVVDQVMLSTNLEGKKFVKVRMRSVRIPEVGDKFASRHGQKGTCGMMFSQEDMPYSREGITPDIIINPHCIPSRMTIAQLIECVTGKVGLMTGKYGDATPFDPLNVDTICNELHNLGYQKYGNEVLYNGRTGRKLDAMIFMGPTYYQRLKHLVNDKEHARAYGPLQNLIRQPTEGRARDGGLRLRCSLSKIFIRFSRIIFC